MNVPHHQSHCSLYPYSWRRNVVVACSGVFDDAFEAQDTELPPAGREIGVGYFGHTCERHLSIIRFLLHAD